MDAEQLRTLQAPLKSRYREEPDAAVITLKASGELGAEGVTCKVETGRALVEAGLHPATGGDGLSLCSGDMLLEALVACAGVTLKAVATALSIPVRSGKVNAEGDLDFRGTLGVAKDAPVGFKDILARHRRAQGSARQAADADRTLLRRLSDAEGHSGRDGLVSHELIIAIATQGNAPR